MIHSPVEADRRGNPFIYLLLWHSGVKNTIPATRRLTSKNVGFSKAGQSGLTWEIFEYTLFKKLKD
jgi:hypothetical protein